MYSCSFFSGKKSIFCLWVHFRRNGYNNAGTFFQEKKIALLEQTEWTMAVVSRVECVDIMRYGIRFFGVVLQIILTQSGMAV